ncbi:hemerythrin domain-containing protein [Streptomyces monticola]|uniref:Hemerythrin domain-containing protein n=1 Tax=Streptomyces monticola TaxID=2666263 RepID=A0ABW2JBV4_9ACTN
MPHSPAHDARDDFAPHDRLLLTFTGADSHERHTLELGYRRDGDRLVVTAGARHDDLLAHSVVTVHLDGEAREAIAVPAADGTGTVVLEPPARPADGEAPVRVRTLADKVLEIHAWLRAQLRHVSAEADAQLAARAAHQGPGAPPAPGLGMQIRQHCLAFCETLTFHHTSEDAHVFPGVAQHHPELRGALERLSAEHRKVARIKEELLALLARMETADPDRFRRELDRLSQELTVHLEYEEEVLLPPLAHVPFPPR